MRSDVRVGGKEVVAVHVVLRDVSALTFPVAEIRNALILGEYGQMVIVNDADIVSTALRFLGNASSNISQERRCRIAEHLNRDVKVLVEDKVQLREAAPLLFGRTFDKVAKDHVDAERSLRKSTGHQPTSKPKRFISDQRWWRSQATQTRRKQSSPTRLQDQKDPPAATSAPSASAQLRAAKQPHSESCGTISSTITKRSLGLSATS